MSDFDPSVIRFDRAPSANFGSRHGSKIDAVIIHQTGRGDLAGHIKDAKDPTRGKSFHYIIGKRGEIVQLVPDQQSAYHAGSSVLRGQQGVNRRSIGIELVNRGDNRDPFPEAQYESLIALVAHLIDKYDIPFENVVGHKDVATFDRGPQKGQLGRRDDPATNFDWQLFRQGVETSVDVRSVPLGEELNDLVPLIGLSGVTSLADPKPNVLDPSRIFSFGAQASADPLTNPFDPGSRIFDFDVTGPDPGGAEPTAPDFDLGGPAEAMDDVDSDLDPSGQIFDFTEQPPTSPLDPPNDSGPPAFDFGAAPDAQQASAIDPAGAIFDFTASPDAVGAFDPAVDPGAQLFDFVDNALDPGAQVPDAVDQSDGGQGANDVGTAAHAAPAAADGDGG